MSIDSKKNNLFQYIFWNAFLLMITWGVVIPPFGLKIRISTFISNIYHWNLHLNIAYEASFHIRCLKKLHYKRWHDFHRDIDDSGYVDHPLPIFEILFSAVCASSDCFVLFPPIGFEMEALLSLADAQLLRSGASHGSNECPHYCHSVVGIG